MEKIKRTKPDVVNVSKLERELRADATLAPEYRGFTYNGTVFELHFERLLDGAINSALAAVFDGFVDEDDSATFTPKILALASGKQRNHTAIDYKTGLKTNLFPLRTFVQGELQRVQWYSDEALTDEVIDVGITYNRTETGFAVDRTTVREWLNVDGSKHPRTKTTKKIYSTDPSAQFQEGVRRRTTLVDKLIMAVLDSMAKNLALVDGSHNMRQVERLGKNFMRQNDAAFEAFKKYSHPQILEDVVVPDERHDAWLDKPMLDDSLQPTGVTIREYIVAELTL